MRSLFAALLLAACSTPAIAPRDCTPGQTTSCACPGGASAVQVCGTDGTLGSCLCPDAGATVDRPDAPAPEDRPAPMDRVELPDVVLERDAGVEDRPDVQPDHFDAGAPDVVVGGDAACREPGVAILRRCANDNDCNACSPGVSGLTWCCRGTGYCENTFACARDGGRYVPDVQIECTGLELCRTHDDCERLCRPRANGAALCCIAGECGSRSSGRCD